jgi:protein-L-isoaspartate(D-aspartate) O-methyltransferase
MAGGPLKPAASQSAVTTASLPGESSNPGLASERVRTRMVERVRGYGVKDPRVLAAIDWVLRHQFVDAALASRAYEDSALPIGYGQTISRPYTVARSAELALEKIVEPRAAKLLEIGTGCGYASAVLARLFGTVISIERLRPLHELARQNLRPLRLPNVRLVFGDGIDGVAREAPFDAIVAAAAGAQIPAAWIEQLKPGGRIVAPVADAQMQEQFLKVISKDAWGRVSERAVQAARFVPLRLGTR